MKQRADGRWRKVIKINGKQITFYSTEKTEKAALKDIEKKMLAHQEITIRKKTFFEVAESWKEKHMDAVSYKTWSGYSAHYNRAVKHFYNDPIDTLQPSDVQIYINKLCQQNFAYKTVKTALGVISMIFDEALMKRYITSNPCAFVKIPSGLSREERKLPSKDEIQKVIDGTSCHFGLFAYLLLYTGIRRGEALALRAEDIDFKNKTIKISKAVYFKSNIPVLKEPKTEAGKRTVYLLDCIAPYLVGKQGYIFGGDKLMSEQAFRRAWERYTKESGVTITPHQLRHAHATLLYEIGIDPKSAQKLLGHADFKTTLDIYTHISEERRASDFEKINSWSNNGQNAKTI